jgi:hypothetical protein
VSASCWQIEVKTLIRTLSNDSEKNDSDGLEDRCHV